MKFRKTTIEDIKSIMQIIDEAKEYFRKMGIDQWQNGYPNSDVIYNDIKNNSSYVLESENKILATAMVSFEADKSYKNIYNGQWLNNEEYAVIHRIAVSEKIKGNGIASNIIKEVEKLCKENKVNSIKIDTHKDNISMQKLLEKNGFKYCGIIYLEDGNERVAFEKIV
ncbi:GNAT family N-acetyltransferase [uncultured Clostridium sp.]|uniref:GNAT family N-acetyltransferase n=1 Tax=Clostridium sp. TaxID=1506 RepID=UPI0025D1B814|nr:GNAT family N-acetyltransferase [uncultured Clostridium sp.]